MESSNPGQSRSGGSRPLVGQTTGNTLLDGTMDAPPMPVADAFTEEIALGSSPGISALTDSDLSTTPAAGMDATASQSSESPGIDVSSVKDAASSGKEAASAGMGRVREWISAHPLVAVGAGLIGGIVLAGSGGGTNHHHHYHGDQGSQPRHDATSGSQSSHDQTQSQSSGQSHGQSHQQQGGGILGMIQQTGLLDTLTQSADRLMKTANGHATELARQRVPGFEEQLRQKGGSATPPAGRHLSETVPGS